MVSVSATTTAQMDGVVVVALDGHLTAATVLQVQAHLAPLLRQIPPNLVVDLSRIGACDCTGALILDVAARVAADCGGEVRLAAPPAPVCQALRQAGTMRVARTYATVHGAIRADPLDLLATAGRWTNDNAAPASAVRTR